MVWDSPIGPDLGFCQYPHFIQNQQLGFPSLTDQNQKLFQRGNGMDVDDFGTLLVQQIKCECDLRNASAVSSKH